MSGNRFDLLPPVIYQLSSLKELWAHSNKIKKIPEEITTLAQLEKVFIGNNPIQNIPKQIANSNDVEAIFNYIRSLGAAKDVEYLYLDFDYWLNIVTLLSKDSPIIVGHPLQKIRIKTRTGGSLEPLLS